MLRNNIRENRLTGDWLWEKASMCAYVYGGFDLPPFKSDYQLFNTFKTGPNDQGYYGVCFIDAYIEEGQQIVDIIFTHRGTVLNFNNLIDDLRVAVGYAPEVYKIALKYVSDTINLLAKLYGAKSINIIENTGHSLGGLLADLVTLKLYSTMSSRYEFSSTTFENPGSKSAAEYLIKKGELPSKVMTFARENCWNLANDINVINCCQEQIGEKNAMSTLDHNFFHNNRTPVMPEATPCLSNFYYLLTYTADQHQIIKLYNQLKNGGEWEDEIDYPVGLKNSYQAYFDFSSRMNYWIGYMKIVWDNDPTQKERFNGNYKNYRAYFIDNLGRIKNQTLQLDQLDNIKWSPPTHSFKLFNPLENKKRSSVIIDNNESTSELNCYCYN